ncbi:RCC1 domain-containing protein [Oligoflexaceae bacterium]|nr:RCC1 domain-containing protein [Oligoflexaceae bacterium]
MIKVTTLDTELLYMKKKTEILLTILIAFSSCTKKTEENVRDSEQATESIDSEALESIDTGPLESIVSETFDASDLSLAESIDGLRAVDDNEFLSVGGLCSSKVVEISFGAQKTQCENGTWTMNLDLRLFPNGPLDLEVTAKSSSDQKTTVELEVVKNSLRKSNYTGEHTAKFFVTVSGEIIAFGNGAYGKLLNQSESDVGDEASETGDNFQLISFLPSKVISIDAGDYHACALLDSGEVKCWGRNDFGQLGKGDTEHYGDNVDETADSLPAIDFGGAKIISIAAVAYSVYFLTEDNKIRSSKNPLEDIDLGYDQPIKQLYGGYGHMCALYVDGKGKCYVGGSQMAAAAYGSSDILEFNSSLPFLDFSGTQTPESFTGSLGNCILYKSGDAHCFGDSNHGRLGNQLGAGIYVGDDSGEVPRLTPYIDWGLGEKVEQLRLHDRHSNCGLLSSGAVKCFGLNGASGYLGVGNVTYVYGSTAATMGDNLPEIDLGADFNAVYLLDNACVVSDKLKIKCWGNNTQGQLGLGDLTSRGRTPTDMGDNLPTIDFGSHGLQLQRLVQALFDLESSD